MDNVGYVVLHYQALEETIACVESIKKKHGNGLTNVIVVDNASPNRSGLLLKERYSEDIEVTTVLTDENLGFAKGLNVGIRVLRDKGCNFAVLLNNDTELINSDWDNIICKKYEQYHYGALGPDIISIDGMRHDNPAEKQDTSITGLQHMLREKRKEYVLNLLYIRPAINRIKKEIKKIIGYTPKTQENRNYDEETAGIQLQGSCMILSPRYYSKYDGLYEKTFLYFEEAILRARCEENNMPCMYTPSLKLLHKGSVSVNGSVITERKRKLFYLKHSYHSVQSYYNTLIENGKGQ